MQNSHNTGAHLVSMIRTARYNVLVPECVLRFEHAPGVIRIPLSGRV